MLLPEGAAAGCCACCAVQDAGAASLEASAALLEAGCPCKLALMVACGGAGLAEDGCICDCVLVRAWADATRLPMADSR